MQKEIILKIIKVFKKLKIKRFYYLFSSHTIKNSIPERDAGVAIYLNKNKNYFKSIPILLSILVLFFSLAYLLHAVWTSPGAHPPHGNLTIPAQTIGGLRWFWGGWGLTGGANEGDVTLDVGAGDGIIVTADAIHTTLGTSITGDEIVDGTITMADLAFDPFPPPGILRMKCGGEWVRIGPVTSSGAGWVEAGGARWDQYGGFVRRNQVPHIWRTREFISPKVSGMNIMRGGGATIHDYCTICRGMHQVYSYQLGSAFPIINRCETILSGCVCDGWNPGFVAVASLTCVEFCTDLQW